MSGTNPPRTGRDDGLFRGIIAESGAEGTQPKNLSAPTARYNNITRAVGCGAAADKLACLRSVSFGSPQQRHHQSYLYEFLPHHRWRFYPRLLVKSSGAGKFTKTAL